MLISHKNCNYTYSCVIVVVFTLNLQVVFINNIVYTIASILTYSLGFEYLPLIFLMVYMLVTGEVYIYRV